MRFVPSETGQACQSLKHLQLPVIISLLYNDLASVPAVTAPQTVAERGKNAKAGKLGKERREKLVD